VWENVEMNRDSIFEQVREVKNALGQLRIREEKAQKCKLEKTGQLIPIGETMKTTVQGSANFIITLEMMFINEEATHNLLKEIETSNLALTNILTKALYKLQISVA
jgi:hypothetical protein